jgi:hypothetical protein
VRHGGRRQAATAAQLAEEHPGGGRRYDAARHHTRGVEVVDGRPVSPGGPTSIRYGRGELGHWGEQLAADAIVTADAEDGR